jgi:hypothetical protein
MSVTTIGWHIDAAWSPRRCACFGQGAMYNRLAGCTRTSCETFEHMGTILLIIVVLLLIGALPHWPYSSGWGYYPSGGLGLLLLILIILLILRYI